MLTTPFAPEDEYQDLLALLGTALGSLKNPDCLGLLGPIMTGATMTQGARVPGTSLELDPGIAAFNLGAMMGESALAAILPVADYLARKAHNEAKLPLCVRDVLAAMSEARHLAQLGHCNATAAALTHLLGGNSAQFAAALQSDPLAPSAEPGSRWAAGDRAARAVRLAYGAMSGAPDTAALPARPGHDASAGLRPAEDFAASVAAFFPAKQAALIAERVADRAVVLAMPVHEFIALLVRNG